MTVSPPDANGFVNFGDLQIMSKLLARNAELVIAEINPGMVHIGGDNSIHVSEIDWFVERTSDVTVPPIVPPRVSEDERRIVDAVCGTVARELIPDRATIQIGGGSTSGPIVSYLRYHH